MADALKELVETYKPRMKPSLTLYLYLAMNFIVKTWSFMCAYVFVDRIFVETSGSAFPAPLAWEVSRLEKEKLANVRLDAIICVIDCLHFSGYQDTSYTAKIQAKFTDLILVCVPTCVQYDS